MRPSHPPRGSRWRQLDEEAADERPGVCHRRRWHGRRRAESLAAREATPAPGSAGPVTIALVAHSSTTAYKSAAPTTATSDTTKTGPTGSSSTATAQGAPKEAAAQRPRSLRRPRRSAGRSAPRTRKAATIPPASSRIAVCPRRSIATVAASPGARRTIRSASASGGKATVGAARLIAHRNARATTAATNPDAAPGGPTRAASPLSARARIPNLLYSS